MLFKIQSLIIFFVFMTSAQAVELKCVQKLKEVITEVVKVDRMSENHQLVRAQSIAKAMMIYREQRDINREVKTILADYMHSYQYTVDELIHAIEQHSFKDQQLYPGRFGDLNEFNFKDTRGKFTKELRKFYNFDGLQSLINRKMVQQMTSERYAFYAGELVHEMIKRYRKLNLEEPSSFYELALYTVSPEDLTFITEKFDAHNSYIKFANNLLTAVREALQDGKIQINIPFLTRLVENAKEKRLETSSDVKNKFFTKILKDILSSHARKLQVNQEYRNYFYTEEYTIREIVEHAEGTFLKGELTAETLMTELTREPTRKVTQEVLDTYHAVMFRKKGTTKLISKLSAIRNLNHNISRTKVVQSANGNSKKDESLIVLRSLEFVNKNYELQEFDTFIIGHEFNLLLNKIVTSYEATNEEDTNLLLFAFEHFSDELNKLGITEVESLYSIIKKIKRSQKVVINAKFIEASQELYHSLEHGRTFRIYTPKNIKTLDFLGIDIHTFAKDVEKLELKIAELTEKQSEIKDKLPEGVADITFLYQDLLETIENSDDYSAYLSLVLRSLSSDSKKRSMMIQKALPDLTKKVKKTGKEVRNVIASHLFTLKLNDIQVKWATILSNAGLRKSSMKIKFQDHIFQHIDHPNVIEKFPKSAHGLIKSLGSFTVDGKKQFVLLGKHEVDSYNIVALSKKLERIKSDSLRDVQFEAGNSNGSYLFTEFLNREVLAHTKNGRLEFTKTGEDATLEFSNRVIYFDTESIYGWYKYLTGDAKAAAYQHLAQQVGFEERRASLAVKLQTIAELGGLNYEKLDVNFQIEMKEHLLAPELFEEWKHLISEEMQPIIKGSF